MSTKIKYELKNGKIKEYIAKGITHTIINYCAGIMIWGIEKQSHSIFIQYENIKKLNIKGVN